MTMNRKPAKNVTIHPRETAEALYAENRRLTKCELPVVCQMCGREEKGKLAECNGCIPLVILNAQLREDRGEKRDNRN